MKAIEFTADNVRIESEMNRRDHWATRKKRFDEQKAAVYWAYRGTTRSGTLMAPRTWDKVRPLTVTLTRIAPRPITDEHDNLRSGFKAVVDMIAELIGCDDGDKSRVSWVYKQEKGRPKEYAVRIKIESKG